jgi:hypothetical protein
VTRVDEFDHFFSSTADVTLKATYAVCGDRNVAFESTVDAYCRAWRDWTKIRNHNPDGWVRTEAWRLTALSRSTHPLRQRHEDDSDRELLTAMAKLRSDDRRLIALLTLGSIDLEDACREVGVPAQQGAESVTTALGGLESSLGQSLDQLEERMHGLSRVTKKLVLPAAGVVRHRAQSGRRRNTILLVVAAIVLTVAGGLVSVAEPKSVDRHRIGDKDGDIVLLAQGLGPDDLLDASEVARLDRKHDWRVLGTDDDLREKTPFATCPSRRLADPDAIRFLVRTFQAGKTEERVAQAVEVSTSPDAAETGFTRMERWFADCSVPGVQLGDTWKVRHSFHNLSILQLVSHQEPTQTFTVGIGISGNAVTTLVHRSDGEKGPDVNAFARVLNDAVAGVCQFLYNDLKCVGGVILQPTEPPAAGTNKEFLAIADLPPVADPTAAWTGVASNWKKHRDAAVCDNADFTGTHPKSRSYVQANSATSDQPATFGLTETVGRFPSESTAQKFMETVRDNLDACPDKNLAAQVDEQEDYDEDSIEGTSWRVRLDLHDGSQARYRTSIIRNGDAVAQVTFTPADSYDISEQKFERLVKRAGQRLSYAD